MRRPEMRDLRIVTGDGRARLTYLDEAERVHELASAPETVEGERWLKGIAYDLERTYGVRLSDG